MFLASSIALFALVLLIVFWVRPSDLPAAPPPDPAAHLEERKAAIYENLRDLTFEFRLGKLSDPDYEKSKRGLQEELARVMAEIDALAAAAPAAAPAVAAQPDLPEPVQAPPASESAAAKLTAAPPAKKPVRASTKAKGVTCPHCRARFDKPMKFCGECGKAMDAGVTPEAHA